MAAKTILGPQKPHSAVNPDAGDETIHLAQQSERQAAIERSLWGDKPEWDKEPGYDSEVDGIARKLRAAHVDGATSQDWPDTDQLERDEWRGIVRFVLEAKRAKS